VSKTGGGPGTNQYRMRGQSKARTIYGYPANQVVRRGVCVWPRGRLDDIWCLRHRQIAPEIRQLAGAAPCVVKLGPKLQRQLVDLLPTRLLGPWISQLSSVAAQRSLMARVPLAQLQWATRDSDAVIRWIALRRMPVDQLGWAATDPDLSIRCEAAKVMPVDQLGWATTDPHWEVRHIAACRMPLEQLRWTLQDADPRIRQVAVRRLTRRQ